MTRTAAPKPSNWESMCDAWDDPEAFARECLAYYAECGQEQHVPHPTEPDADAEQPLELF